MSESQPITQQLQELETYITSLVDSLQRGELPISLKPVRHIFDALLIQALPQLKVPAPKFIELYNDLPTILSAYAINVNLTATSYQSRSYQQAIFERQPQGNYWIVMTSPDRGWLVPNPTKNTTTLNSLNLAFDLPPEFSLPGGLTVGRGDLNHLQLPGIVKLLPTTPTTWQVSQRGQIIAVNSKVIINTDNLAIEACFKKQDEHTAKIENLSDRLQDQKTETSVALSEQAKVIKTLSNYIEVIAKQPDERTAEIEKLSDRLQKLEQFLQNQQIQASTTLSQESLENEKNYDQEQELHKAFGCGSFEEI